MVLAFCCAFSRLSVLSCRATQRRRQHTPTFEARPPTPPHAGFGFKDEKPTAEESEKAARDLAEAALASASALAADAHAVDPAYTAKPTAFLYRGHTAQIATSTAGMYGEMIESFIKQVGGIPRGHPLSVTNRKLLLFRLLRPTFLRCTYTFLTCRWWHMQSNMEPISSASSAI